MARYTKRQAAIEWVQEGGPANAAGLMAEIAWSESGGNDLAVSSTGCVGRYQLCPPPPDARDGRANTRHAIQKWANGQGHGHWTKFNRRAKVLHDEWVRSPRRFDRHTRGTTPVGLLDSLPNPLDPFGLLPGAPNPGAPGIPNPLDIPNPLEGIDAIADAIRGVANAIKDAFDWLTSSETWLSVGKIIVGIMLAGIGLRTAASRL